jgi:hypothetical protein
MFWQEYSHFRVFRLSRFVGVAGNLVKFFKEGARYGFMHDAHRLVFNKPPILKKLAPGVKVLAPVSMSRTNRLVYADTTVKSVTSGQVVINPPRKQNFYI